MNSINLSKLENVFESKWLHDTSVKNARQRYCTPKSSFGADQFSRRNGPVSVWSPFACVDPRLSKSSQILSH
jgi:hypothetical protein